MKKLEQQGTLITLTREEADEIIDNFNRKAKCKDDLVTNTTSYDRCFILDGMFYKLTSIHPKWVSNIYAHRVGPPEQALNIKGFIRHMLDTYDGGHFCFDKPHGITFLRDYLDEMTISIENNIITWRKNVKRVH